MATKYVKEFELMHAQIKKQFKIDCKNIEDGK